MKQLPYINNSDGIIGYSESTIAKNETNDCFVRAVASSFEIPYDKAHEWVRKTYKRQNRKGTRYATVHLDKMSNDKLRMNKKLVKIINGLSKIDIIVGKTRRTTVNQFIKKYPTGTYLIIVRGHAFTLKNGSVVGNPSDSKSIKKGIYNAYQIG